MVMMMVISGNNTNNNDNSNNINININTVIQPGDFSTGSTTERCVNDQMFEFFNHMLSKYQCGFQRIRYTAFYSWYDIKVKKMGKWEYKGKYVNRSLKNL